MRLVDRGLQQVRRVGAAVGIPADVELHRGDRAVGIVRLDVEPIAAGLRGQRNPRRLVGGDGDVAVGDARGRLDRLVLPVDCSGDTIGSATPSSGARSAGRRGASVLPSGETNTTSNSALSPSATFLSPNSGLMPIMAVGGRDRQHQLALDGAAAGLDHADEDLRLLRPRRGRRLGQRDREGRNAIGVGLRQVLDRRALVGGGLLVGDAELVAGESPAARPRARPACRLRAAAPRPARHRGNGRRPSAPLERSALISLSLADKSNSIRSGT